MEPTRPSTPHDAPLALPAHLERVGLLQRGGMGEVWRVLDRRLDREMALKVGHPDVAFNPALRRRFENEARITARLDHPGVVPVHEAGVLPDGRPFFTMRTVHGDTLAALSRRTRTPLTRLMEVFERVCLTVAFAHQRGVVHADLKPDNVIVGEFGEVVVLDWGIARLTSDPSDGEVIGTPGFMAPEVRAGEPPGPAADVYALGASLYDLLVGVSPRGGDDVAEAAARRGREVPGPLADIVRRALSEETTTRPTATEMAGALAAWRDRSLRREEAERLLVGSLPLAADAARRREEAETLAAQADTILGGLAPDAPEESRRPGWELLEEAGGRRTEAEILEARFVEGLQAALRVDDGLDAAHDRLADHHRARLLAAEARGDTPGAARERVSFVAHARGPRRAWLDAPARLWLDAEPGPAAVQAWRYKTRFGRLELEAAGPLGTTPLRGATLPPGSWRLDLEGPDGARAHLPVRVGRDEEVDLGRVTLLAGLSEDERYVPAGWALVGGDPDAPDAVAGRRVWVDGFVMARFPVTNGAFLVFLDDLVARGEEATALALQPVQTDGRGAEGVPVFRRAPDGRFLLGASADGLPWGADWPVTLVSWHAARAYAAWEAARTGQPWRLPDEWEWEKAARGVDGRRYPWGDRMDPSWACMQLSHVDRPGRVAITRFPTDESPYGVRGLGGNVRDWCLNRFGRGPAGERVVPGEGGGDERWRITRGGAWNSAAAFCLAAARFTTMPERTATTVGIRLARGLPTTG